MSFTTHINTELDSNTEIEAEDFCSDPADMAVTFSNGSYSNRVHVSADLDTWADFARKVLAEVERRHAEPDVEDDPDDMSATPTGAIREAEADDAAAEARRG